MFRNNCVDDDLDTASYYLSDARGHTGLQSRRRHANAIGTFGDKDGDGDNDDNDQSHEDCYDGDGDGHDQGCDALWTP